MLNLNKNHLLIAFIVILIIYFSLAAESFHRGLPRSVKNRWNECHHKALERCKIPDLTSENCWKNEHQNCSYRLGRPANWKTGRLGSYAQCVNNNLEPPNNLINKCGNRRFDVAEPTNKISEICYASFYDRCRRGKEI